MNVAPDRLHQVVTVARRLAETLGEPGACVIADRARALEAAGEFEDARFWGDVARAMRLLGGAPGRRHPRPQAG